MKSALAQILPHSSVQKPIPRLNCEGHVADRTVSTDAQEYRDKFIMPWPQLATGDEHPRHHLAAFLENLARLSLWLRRLLLGRLLALRRLLHTGLLGLWQPLGSPDRRQIGLWFHGGFTFSGWDTCSSARTTRPKHTLSPQQARCTQILLAPQRVVETITTF